MKNLFKTLTLIGLSLSLSLNGQTGSNKTNNQVSNFSTPSSAKAAYVNNQDFLSPSSLQPYANAFGDSLRGFDEASVKAKIINLRLSGSEGAGYMHYLKRTYINKKYHLVPEPIMVTSPQPTTGGPGRNIGNGNNFVNVAPCVNEDFESTTPGQITSSTGVTGWTLYERTADGNCSPTSWTPGSSEFWILSTPITSWYSAVGSIANSPLGGNNIAQLNDFNNNLHTTKLTQTFPVTTANTLFQFAYAGFWQDGGHACCDQPAISVRMYDCNGQPLACSNLSLASGSGCQSANVTFTQSSNGSWTNWQVKYIDLTPYIGSCVTIDFITTDCPYSGHWGSTLFDAKCGGQLIGTGLGGVGGSIAGPVSFCAGAGVAQISAPLGYSSYQWYAPGSGSIAAPNGTMATLTIQNPQPGSVYTVVMVAPSGCVFNSTNVLNTSTVNIAGIGSSSSCPGGASGTATVVGNGSGSGYTYTWTNSSNSVVGSSAVAVGLPAGIYSVGISGLGAAGCGSAGYTVAVGTAPPGVQTSLKPFCSGEAYLGTTGGSNFQWYNNSLAAISATAGGNLPTYTVTSPVSNQNYYLRYLSNQGCQDSIKFILVQTAPGLMVVSNVAPICPGGSNGTATINLSPATGAPPGLNTYSVFGINTTVTPVYTAYIGPTASGIYTATGLSAGTYSVSGFDGSCKYGTTFSVIPHTYVVSINPSSTLCPGTSTAVGLTFVAPPALGQYSYTWTPNIFLAGNANHNQSTIITPSAAIGTQTTINYTVVVTPSLVNCPTTLQMSVTSVNPPIPTITAIPNLCNTFQPYTIITSPSGGTFNAVGIGTNNPISSIGGIITPSLAPSILNPTAYPNGNNPFTYSISVLGCIKTQTATYHVSKFWSSALSSPTVSPMCVTNNPFNLMNIVQSTVNGTWLGTGVQSGTTFNPANLNTNNYVVTYSTNSSPNPTVCPSTTTLNVPVTKTITPFISQVPQFCTNANPITMTVNPPGGGWTGNSAVSNAGVITPANAIVPNSTVTYSVIIGPCLNTNTTTLNTVRFNTAAFAGTIQGLCYNSNPVNLMSIVQSTVNGSWSPPVNAPLSIQQNTFFPGGGIATNTYVLTYNTTSSPNPSLCPDSKTIAVAVSNPPAPTITQVGPFCNNRAPLQLSVTPNSGSWTGSAYLSPGGTFSPGLTSIGNNAVQYVVGNATCNVQQTKYISIEAFVPATITSHFPDQCNTGPVINLTPLTLTSLGTWNGPGIVGTSFNPALAGAGHFILTHNTASSPSGLCPDQAIVAVNVFSLASPAVTNIGPFCDRALPVQLIVSPTGGFFGGPNTGVVSRSGLFNPASAIIGDNIINYSITAGPCVAYAQTIVKVEKFVSADIAKPAGPFCRNSDQINLNSYVLNPDGDWSGPGVVGSMFYPSVANAGNTNLIVYETHSSPTRTLCPDTSMMRIEVRDLPNVIAVANVAAGCAPLEVIFNTPNVNAGEGLWTLGDGSEPVKGLTISHVYTSPGSYTVQFNYSDGIGCKANPAIANPISVYGIPKPDFAVPDEILISDPQVKFINLTGNLNNYTYYWEMGGLPVKSSNGVDGEVEFIKIGKYQITLTASSIYGCKEAVSKTIEVKNNFNIFIPNSFSPNFDGLNDTFAPVFTNYGLDTKSFEMEIFDRWGHSLYRTKDPVKGWDGSIQNKGEPLKEEVYIYRIKYKDLDGNSYNKMGHLSLVK
jgi:gliding motility-associated-like protein